MTKLLQKRYIRHTVLLHSHISRIVFRFKHDPHAVFGGDRPRDSRKACVFPGFVFQCLPYAAIIGQGSRFYCYLQGRTDGADRIKLKLPAVHNLVLPVTVLVFADNGGGNFKSLAGCSFRLLRLFRPCFFYLIFREPAQIIHMYRVRNTAFKVKMCDFSPVVGYGKARISEPV